MRKNIVRKFYPLLILLVVCSSCKKYLDVVPDNIPTIDNAFTLSLQAKKFLFTCYSYMPRDGDLNQDPAMVGGDEIWRINANAGELFNIARGFQNIVNPYGGGNWGSLYRGIRDCNIFLENIDKVPDMEETDRRRWISEVKFLKAYYHFYLVRMYGPIPLVKTNLPIGAGTEEVQVVRSPVDSCFKYITELIDEATPGLPLVINDPVSELGRITQPIALSLKAKVLVTAASKLFNGNTDQEQLVNHDGTKLFNTEEMKSKWVDAAEACKDAIEMCHQVGMKLYYYKSDFSQYDLSEAILTQLNIRNATTQRWNSEIIWANTQTNSSYLQLISTPPLAPQYADNYTVRGELSPPLKIAEMFYSKNGLPIEEDKDYDYTNRYDLKKAGVADKLLIKTDYTTVALHFNREPRFYANLGFDGGIWYGHERYDDKKDLFFLEAKKGQRNSGGSNFRSTVTGYFIKKLIHFQNVIGGGLTQTYSSSSYPWPVIRLSDLYLLYAESLNESEGPVPLAHEYINLVRKRAGLKSVEESWTEHSTNPTRYQTQSGLREIIRRERLIELAFEGQRFWDLRRWRIATTVLSTPIKGWDLLQETEKAYYVPKVILNQSFGTKDYFWPIADREITVNRNLVQNLGW